jgi:predicted PurR-regulated permease PerM
MEGSSPLTPWRAVQAAAALLVLGFFLYATRSVLNPVFLFALLWAVLLPFRHLEGYTTLLVAAAVVTLSWLLASTGSLLVPFVLSLLVAYALDPAVDALERRGVGRTVAIVLLALPALGLLAVTLVLVIPAAIEQLGEIARQAPLFLDRVVGWLEDLRERLLRLDVPLVDEEAFFQRLRSIDSASVAAFVESRRAAVASWIWGGVLGVGRGLGSFLAVLGYVAVTPVLTFYLLRDWDAIMRRLAGLLPPGRRAAIVSFAAECDRMVARYLRGQATVALVIGILTGVGLWIARFPYAGTLGLIVAVFSVVPYLGIVLSLVPAIFIALVSGSVAVSLLKVAVVYGAAQLLEATVISPRIVGGSVGLHPVLVLLALALGGFFFGFVGLLIGVPVAAVAKLLVQRGVEAYEVRLLAKTREQGTSEP